MNKYLKKKKKLLNMKLITMKKPFSTNLKHKKQFQKKKKGNEKGIKEIEKTGKNIRKEEID